MTEHKHKWTLYRIILDADKNVNRRYYCLECPKEGQKIGKLNILNNSEQNKETEQKQQVEHNK